MRHWLFNLSSGVSLLLCLAVLAAWAPSYRWGDSLYFNRRAADGTVIEYGLVSEAGAVGVAVVRITGADPTEPLDRWTIFQINTSAIVPRNVWERIGFYRLHQRIFSFGVTVSADGVCIPDGLAAILCAVMPVQWWRVLLRRRRAQRRSAAGQCRRCGYNLAGNLSGICPECGENIRGATSPTST